MDIDQIRALLELVAESGVAEVELEDDEFRMVVRTVSSQTVVQQAPQVVHAAAAAPVATTPAGQPAAAPPPAPAAEAEAPASGTTVKAPIVGTFYEAPSPDAGPFVKVGDTVKVGDVLCIIEAMKLMNEIESEVSGVIKEILVQNAQPVQYDEPLFIVDPS